MRVLLILLLSLAVCPALAAVQQPEFDPTLGRQIDMSTSLTDETGRTATLETFTAGRPALILFGYHNCPNQCGVAQQVIASALSRTGLGDEVAPLFITLAPEEGPSDAAAAKDRLVGEAGSAAAARWRFLSDALNLDHAREIDTARALVSVTTNGVVIEVVAAGQQKATVSAGRARPHVTRIDANHVLRTRQQLGDERETTAAEPYHTTVCAAIPAQTGKRRPVTTIPYGRRRLSGATLSHVAANRESCHAMDHATHHVAARRSPDRCDTHRCALPATPRPHR